LASGSVAAVTMEVGVGRRGHHGGRGRSGAAPRDDVAAVDVVAWTGSVARGTSARRGVGVRGRGRARHRWHRARRPKLGAAGCSGWIGDVAVAVPGRGPARRRGVGLGDGSQLGAERVPVPKPRGAARRCSGRLERRCSSSRWWKGAWRDGNGTEAGALSVEVQLDVGLAVQGAGSARRDVGEQRRPVPVAWHGGSAGVGQNRAAAVWEWRQRSGKRRKRRRLQGIPDGAPSSAAYIVAS
jgi:hypothetical protein